MKIAVAIVDDSSQNRLSLADHFNYSDEVEVTFTARNGKAFLEKMKELPAVNHPQVVLMDIEMPEMDGIETVQYARQLYPEIKYLMFTVFDDDEKIFEAIKAGANGYLLKDEKVSTMIDYIEQLVEIGGAPMSPAIARKTLQLLSKASLSVKDDGNRNDVSTSLSERETDVLKLLVEGKDYKMISQKLFLSTHTVRKHIANIYSKLHVSSKAQVINLAHQKRWFQ